jgi:hypothetical protein
VAKAQTPFVGGCLPSPVDDRDLNITNNHPTLAAEGVTVSPPSASLSPVHPALDQPGPQCVGNGVVQAANIMFWPIYKRWLFDESSAINLYNRCKLVDGYPGDGTYIRVALKIAQTEGILGVDGRYYKIGTYYTVDNQQALKSTIATLKKPVVIGSVWYWTTASGGLMRDPVGDLTRPAPGHCVIVWRYLVNYNLNYPSSYYGEEMNTDENSWGFGWGTNGNGNIKQSTAWKYQFEAWTFDVPSTQS